MFTLNNPDVLTPGFWRSVPKYVIWQLEKGENGTEHYQGYAVWKKKIKLAGVKKCLPRAHWEIRRGTHEEARDYSSKEDTRLDGPWTFGSQEGIPVKAGQRNDLLHAKRKIDDGATMEEMFDDPETHGTMIRHHRAYRVYKRLKSKKREWPMEIITLIGETGTGKSRWASETYPDSFSVASPKGSGLYFDDYDEHKQVVFEEMDGSYFQYKDLLKFTDRYKINVPVHHGCVNFNADTIVFTTNHHPDEWYDTTKYPWMGGPLQRRMTTNGSRIYRVDMGGVLNLLEGEEPVILGCRIMTRGMYPDNKP